MKKFILIITLLFLGINTAFSMEELITANQIQTHIDNLSARLYYAP